MKKQTACEYESEIVKSLKSGFQTGEIAEHLRGCADCRETSKVALFFQTNLMNEPPPKNLPVAGLIWWKSRLREKQRAGERVAQPILIVQTAAAAGFAGLLVWLFGSDVLQISLSDALGRVFNSLTQILFPMFIGLTCFAVICFTLILVLRRLMPEK